MGESRTIAVFDREELIETRECREMQFPDGRPGALWRGLVFPIEAGDRIDVSREGTQPSQCTRSGATTGRREFAVVEGADEAWLLVAGDVVNRDRAASQLRAAGYSVLRVGQWLGDTVDGFEGDWFIRFVRPNQASDLAAELGTFLDLAPVPTRTPDDLRMHLLELELAASRAREASLSAELARLRHARAEPGKVDAAELDAMRNEVENERQHRIAAEAAWAAAQRERDEIKQALADMRSASHAEPLPKVARRIVREVEIAFESLLPHIRPLRDSVVVAAGEFRDRRSLYRCLGELQRSDGRIPPHWKKLQGAEGWWERHVSNGDDDAGRLYAQFDSGARIWSILLSHKGEQERDIAWLRKQ